MQIVEFKKKNIWPISMTCQPEKICPDQATESESAILFVIQMASYTKV